MNMSTIIEDLKIYVCPLVFIDVGLLLRIFLQMNL